MTTRRRRLVIRAVIPLLLMLGGIGSAVYGLAFHSALVLVEEQVEAPAPPPGFAPPPSPFMFQPPPAEEPAPETRVLLQSVREPHLIQDVSVGGVERLDSGELRRTYSGRPPSLCPT